MQIRELLLLLLIFILNCGGDTAEMLVSKEVLADGFGNHDGEASEDEITFIDDYFKTNREAWTFTVFSSDYYTKDEIPFSVVMEIITNHNLRHPLPSQDEFLNVHEGMSILTPYISIFNFTPDSKISNMFKINNFYKAPGGSFSERDLWKPMKILD